ncbi:MAG: MBL fold metallo-hydrolase [Myxococcales bacterium]|jgi:7,8-dihydropterin-6-yl-methyl-4-(beta-D-ribofuranosyl)aminobenzene 5'-phosphate synthase
MPERLRLGLVALLLSSAGLAAPNTGSAQSLRIDVVYDNVPGAPGFVTGWGFSCLIRGLRETILFDTGADGETLLSNLRRLGVAPEDIDVVVLSHAHRDHTGGLRALLSRHGDKTLYLLSSFPESLKRMARSRGARVVTVEGPRQLVPGAHTTGPMGARPQEQALVLSAAAGPVVVTGCAHPGIERILARVTELHAGRVALLIGGLHLLRADAARLQRVIAALRAARVQRLAPSHCTGDAAIGRLKAALGERVVAGGCGVHFELPLSAPRPEGGPPPLR